MRSLYIPTDIDDEATSMSMQDMMAPGERLRRLAALAGLSLSKEEVDRLTPLQEFLMDGLRRLHQHDYGDVEPVLLRTPSGGTDDAAN
jgi:hypothetical protein